MNERNSGRGIFYGVIGVATLVVAIIGATFAYFTATVTPADGSDNVAGGTNNNIGGSMTLSVTRILPNKASYETTSGTNGLIPAVIDGTIGAIDKAVKAGCVDPSTGYIGCHVYKIDASSTVAAGTASINLDSLTLTKNGDTLDDNNWYYAIYTGNDVTAASDGAATKFAPGATAPALIKSIPATGVDMHDGGALVANSHYYYYLIIYLQDNNAAQNVETSGTNATASYSGTVTMNAAGGQVKATFDAVVTP